MKNSDFSAEISSLKTTGSALGGMLHITDLPVLQLGIVGFSPSQRVQIEGVVKLLPHKTAVWRVVRFSDAHAWLICGNKVRVAAGDVAATSENLMVLAGSPSEKTVTLNVREINRPLAFSTPLPHAEIQPGLTFDAASPQVELSWVTDSQLRILNELCSRPASFQQLVERLGMRHESLALDLACLYFATSLTTIASKAASVSGKRRSAAASSSPAIGTGHSPHIFDSSMSHSGASADSHELTAPAQLRAD